MDVNDDARCLGERVALQFFASKLAPTDIGYITAYGYAAFR
jgi:hypothetical protein